MATSPDTYHSGASTGSPSSNSINIVTCTQMLLSPLVGYATHPSSPVSSSSESGVRTITRTWPARTPSGKEVIKLCRLSASAASSIAFVFLSSALFGPLYLHVYGSTRRLPHKFRISVFLTLAGCKCSLIKLLAPLCQPSLEVLENLTSAASWPLWQYTSRRSPSRSCRHGPAIHSDDTLAARAVSEERAHKDGKD